MTAVESSAFNYVESDIPEGVTLQDWRRRNCPVRAERPRFARLRRLGRH